MNWHDPEARFALLNRVGPEEYGRQFAQHMRTSTLEFTAGHSIRRVPSRFGILFAVGFTGRAFSTREEARTFARENPARQS